MADNVTDLTSRIRDLSDHDEIPETQLWVVASGKGGVGKTFISASLGLTLSKLGHSVVIVDLDLSGANLHTSLGMEPSHLSIRQYFEGSKTLQETVLPTPYPHLSFVQGFWDSWTPTDFSLEHTQKLIADLKALKADYVIVDLSPGSQDSTLELLRVANEKIIVSTPEPTSIEKTYRFVESFMAHSLKHNSQPEAYTQLIQTLRAHRQRILDRPFSFRSYLKENEGIRSDFFESLTNAPVRLIINSSRSQSNIDLGYSIKSVCSKYYDLSIDYMGAVDYDNAVWQSVRNREPVLIAQPFTPLAGQFLTICKHLIDPSELRAVV
jgi:flagellar biosynthesis protein FlhG